MLQPQRLIGITLNSSSLVNVTWSEFLRPAVAKPDPKLVLGAADWSPACTPAEGGIYLGLLAEATKMIHRDDAVLQT